MTPGGLRHWLEEPRSHQGGPVTRAKLLVTKGKPSKHNITKQWRATGTATDIPPFDVAGAK
jgi:hypothetical protein